MPYLIYPPLSFFQAKAPIYAIASPDEVDYTLIRDLHEWSWNVVEHSHSDAEWKRALNSRRVTVKTKSPSASGSRMPSLWEIWNVKGEMMGLEERKTGMAGVDRLGRSGVKAPQSPPRGASRGRLLIRTMMDKVDYSIFKRKTKETTRWNDEDAETDDIISQRIGIMVTRTIDMVSEPAHSDAEQNRPSATTRIFAEPTSERRSLFLLPENVKEQEIGHDQTVKPPIAARRGCTLEELETTRPTLMCSEGVDVDLVLSSRSFRRTRSVDTFDLTLQSQVQGQTSDPMECSHTDATSPPERRVVRRRSFAESLRGRRAARGFTVAELEEMAHRLDL